MKVIGFKTIPLTTIVLPGDFRSRLELDHVREKSKSIEQVGLLHEPIVRKADMRLLAGEDRVAAMYLLCTERGDEPRCLVKLVECTDEEAQDVRDHENVYRRHDLAEQRATLARIVERKAEQIAIANAPKCANPKHEGMGRPKLPTTIAREQVAKALNTSPRAIEAAIHRFEQQQMATRPVHERPKPVPTIKTLGIELGQEWLDEVTTIQAHLTACANRLRSAQVDLTAVRDMHGGTQPAYPQARLNRLYELIHAAAFEVRAAIPESLCPFCKGLSGIQEECAACVTLGFVTGQQMAQVPAELLVEGPEARVLHHGRTWLVSELALQPEVIQGLVPPATAIEQHVELSEAVTGAPPSFDEPLLVTQQRVLSHEELSETDEEPALEQEESWELDS